ncbi:MAG: hypothetical protein LZF86_10205 [Nitrospira sp.]|nr:MAG: hypothetical protein LZF86_10205 [Nitrospira sp.]
MNRGMNRREEGPILMEGLCRVNLPCDSVGFCFGTHLSHTRNPFQRLTPANLAPSLAFCY